jgi:lambda repressor-like predicted transcriptional regulator
MFIPGIIIKHELEKAGFSEAKVARKAKVSRYYVSLIIYGKRKANRTKGKRVKKIICEIIKANPKDLWGSDVN